MSFSPFVGERKGGEGFETQHNRTRFFFWPARAGFLVQGGGDAKNRNICMYTLSDMINFFVCHASSVKCEQFVCCFIFELIIFRCGTVECRFDSVCFVSRMHISFPYCETFEIGGIIIYDDLRVFSRGFGILIMTVV